MDRLQAKGDIENLVRSLSRFSEKTLLILSGLPVRSTQTGIVRAGLKSLQEIVVEDNGKTLATRSECKGVCGKVFQSVGVAIPPTIREM
jgi:hypothetical protein